MPRAPAPTRGRATPRRWFALCASVACFAIACGRDAGPRWELVTIASDELRLADAAGEPASAELRADGDVRTVVLAPRREPFGDPAVRVFDVRPEAGGAPIGRLLLGPSRAALHYHLASRDPVLPSDVFRANRLVFLKDCIQFLGHFSKLLYEKLYQCPLRLLLILISHVHHL